MRTCRSCETRFKGAVCPQCGTAFVSEVSDTLASLTQGMVPNLAALFQAGKDAGLIKPAPDYGQTS